MKRSGIVAISRPIRYRKEEVEVDGVKTIVTTPQEKGIDVRLALDVVSMARKGQFDVAIIFSQDQDLCEVVQEVRDISIETDRWMKVVCAFPDGPKATSRRGIDKTDWIRIDEATTRASTRVTTALNEEGARPPSRASSSTQRNRLTAY